MAAGGSVARRAVWWVLLVVVAAASVALVQGRVPCEALATQPACQVAMQPGPVQDSLSLISIGGADSYPPGDGQLQLTTVAVQENLGIGEWLLARTTPSVDLVPREQIYPTGMDREQVAELNRAAMLDSQLTAAIVALESLGFQLDAQGARVVGIQADAVTDVLELDDVIVALDGAPIAESVGVVEQVQARAPGEQVRLTLRRDGSEREVEVTLGRAPDDPDRAYVGVLLTTELDLPVDIEVDSGTIGGPSAGLIFALALLELLEPEDLLEGRVVAGTGSLARDGSVGAVGGVPQKLAAAAAPRDGGEPAEVFLVPRDNLAQARAAAVSRDLLVVPVGTLQEAIAALEALRTGRQPTDGFVLAAG